MADIMNEKKEALGNEEISNEEVKETQEDVETGESVQEEALNQERDEAAAQVQEQMKNLFTKRKEKKDKAQVQIDELNDKVRRQMAEFDNFRKRSEKEKSQMFEIGAKSVIEKILPVVDNFERGLAAIPEEEKESPFVLGMEKTYKQLLAELEHIGVNPIAALGQTFDPELHNAVMQVQSEDLESGMVAQELLKGYKYRDSVVRHSMVGVVE